MIELRDDSLVFTFPEVHRDATFAVSFQRTLRIPDDGHDYPLPAGLGRFPLRHVDDFAATVPSRWLQHGGVMMPMYQSEALWLDFVGWQYPFALKIAAGKINAVTGGEGDLRLHFGGSPSQRLGRAGSREQDYVVVSRQPWLDGFNVGQGRIRQFVAMPLGQGYTAEEQVTGRAETGGLQLLAYPMKASFYRELVQRTRREGRLSLGAPAEAMAFAAAAPDMGLGAGGSMRQDITADPFEPEVWDLGHPARCFVHLANSVQWAGITGSAPPTPPITAQQYRDAGIPWFGYYAQGDVVPGSPVLQDLKTVTQVAADRGEVVTDDTSIPIDRVTHLREPGHHQVVRELPD